VELKRAIFGRNCKDCPAMLAGTLVAWL